MLVACGTVSSNCLDEVEKTAGVPVIGVVKPAAAEAAGSISAQSMLSLGSRESSSSEISPAPEPVSYTHLDVYKRQGEDLYDAAYLTLPAHDGVGASAACYEREVAAVLVQDAGLGAAVGRTQGGLTPALFLAAWAALGRAEERCV